MFATVVGIILAAASQGETNAVDDFFTLFTSQRNALQTLEASFEQTTITPDEIIESSGTIVYVKPKRLIFRYEDPPLEYMLDRLNAYEYDPEFEQLQIYELEDRPESEAFYLGFESDAERLQEAYTVRILPSADDSLYALALEFVPKEKEGEEPYFQRITLHLRIGDLLPAKIEIVNDEESSVRFEVSDFRINPDLGPDKTHINLPEGTDVIDNDTYSMTVGPEGLRVPQPKEETAAQIPLVEDSDLP